MQFIFRDLYRDQREFSVSTFGPGYKTQAILRHIQQEIQEVKETAGQDVIEWADILLLCLDGGQRSGIKYKEFVDAMCSLGGSAQTSDRHFDFESYIKTKKRTTFGTIDEPTFFGTLETIRQALRCIYQAINVEGARSISRTESFYFVTAFCVAIDGAVACGHTPDKLCRAVFGKLKVNTERDWPDWRKHDRKQPVQHIRSNVK